ncbi:MAG: hypothetical protein RhofKO_07630 [Rhodothermales bacterium]
MVALMARRVASALFVVLVSSALAASALAQVTWTGGGDGLSWSDGANWDVGFPPNSTDDVVIALANATVQYDAIACCDISNLTLSGNGAQLEVVSGNRLDVRGDLTFSAGSITGEGDFNVDGTVNWSDGDFTGTGASDLFSTVNVTGFGTRRITDRTINFFGDVNVTNTNTNFDLIVRQTEATLSIYNGATFSFLTDRAAWLASGNTTLYLEGTIQKTSGTGSNVFATTLSSSGTLTAASGTLQLTLIGASNEHSGTVTMTGSDAKVQFQGPGASATFDETQFSGPGTIDFNFLTSTVTDATFNVTGTTRIAGITSIDATSTLTNFGDLTVLSNTSVAANAEANNVSVNNATLTLTALLTASGTGSFTLASLAGAGGMDVESTLTLSNATVRDGNLLQGNGGVDITGQVQLQGGFLYANAGGTWSAGDIILSNSSSLTLNSTFEITGDNQIIDNGGADRVSNFGTLVKTEGAGATDIFVDVFNTGGTVQADSGTLNFEGGFEHTGNATLAPNAGATIRLSPRSGFNETFPTTTTIAGAGTFVFEGSGSTLTLEGTYDVTGGSQFTAGTVLFNDDPQLRNLGDIAVDGATTQVTIDSGTNITASALTLERGTLTLQRTFFPTSFLFRSGTLISNGTVLTPELTWESGTIQGGGLNATTTAIFSTDGTKTFDDANYDGNATITWTGGDIVLQNGAFISHNGTFNVQTDADLLKGTGDADLFHNAPFVKAANTGTTQIQPDVDVSNTVTIGEGSTLAYEGDVTNFFDQNDFQFGRIEGVGTLDLTNLASLNNAGVLAPGLSPGVLSVTGPYDHQTATLEIELGGTTAGTDYDQLAVSGAVSLSGTLDVSLINGFTPNAGATFSIITGGSISGTFDTVNLPTLGGGLTMSVAYNATDVQLVVSGSNASPVANDDAATIEEGGTTTVDVLANDTDADGTLDATSVIVVGQPGFGTATVNADGTITYENNSAFIGDDAFTYTVNDDDGATSNTATVTITIQPGNLPPGAVDDTASTAEGVQITIDVLANDFDADGTLDATSVTLTTPPTNGDTSVNNDGTITYFPDGGFTGTDSFIYTVDDDDGATSNPATVTITVSAGNAPPVATDDVATIEEGGSTIIAVLANDTDADGTLEASTVTVVSSPAFGEATVNADGTITYVNNTIPLGDDSFTYTVNDDDGATSNEATVAITIEPANTFPGAVNDTASTAEDTPITINVLANDFDTDGTLDASTVAVTSEAANGMTTVNTDGTITYAPNTGFTGSDSFSYTVDDDDGATSNPATVTITVSAGNAPPVATDDAATITEGAQAIIPVLINDTDADGTLDPATVSIATAPSSGNASANIDGTIIYTPATDFIGTDVFTYTVNDDDGATSNEATVTVTVEAVNVAPTATDDGVTTAEDTAITIDVLANDIDSDGTLDATSVTLTTPPTNGDTSVNNDGTITYFPDGGFTGTDSFVYTVDDDDGATSNPATVTVTVEAGNNAPVAADDAATTDEDVAVTIDVLSNDTDSDGTLDAASVAIGTAPTNGNTTVNADGTIAYTPSTNFNGTDTFTYTVSDDDGAPSNAATVTVTVNAVNDAPVAADDAASTILETAVAIDVLDNDSDVDGTLNAASVTLATSPANGTATVDADGRITYTPATGFLGTDTFTYTVDDNTGATSNAATVTLTVSPDNATPVAANDTAATDEDTAVTIPILDNDTDDGPLDTGSVQIVQAPTLGILVLSAAGTVTYTPNANATGTDTFTYTVADTEGARSNTATVTITISPVNDAPIAQDDAVTTDEDTAIAIDVLANDADAEGEALTVATFTEPTLGQVARVANGQLVYTPNANINGTDSFTYTARDASGTASETATVIVTIRSVNDVPIAQDDAAVTDQDTAIVIEVRANDSDVDHDASALTLALQTAPTNGQVLVNQQAGTFQYTPNTGFSGDDRFRYLVRDPDGGASNIATVQVTVRPVIVGNTPPVAANDTATTDEDTAVVIDVLANDTDADGTLAPATVSIAAAPATGTTAIDANNGQITYTPNTDFSGTDTFQYTVRDEDGAVSNAATVTITVNAITINAPVANDDTATTEEDTALQLDLLANDTADGTIDPASLSIVTAPTLGTLEADAQGRITYTPNADVNGTDTFTYTVDDTEGRSSNEARVTITIAPVNDAPFAQDDAATTLEDTAITLPFDTLLSNDSDLDGDVLRITAVGPAERGTTELGADGIRYTPNAEVNGTDTFAYTVTDPDGLTSQATVTVTIEAVNDAPVAQDDTASTDEDTPITVDVLANDLDVDGDALTLTLLTAPTNGTVEVESDQRIRYAPTANFSGIDTFTYRITDPDGLSSEATVSIAVGNSADAPIAQDDAATTNEDTPVQIGVLANDTDPDGDALRIQSTTTPTLGTVAIAADAQTLTYMPNADVSGTDTFTYTVTDGNDGFATATVTVTITPVNDAPTATDDEALTSAFTPVLIDILANDTDPEDDALTLVASSDSREGGTTRIVEGQIRYVPPSNFEGDDGFSYTIEDASGATAVGQVTVTVGPLRYEIVEIGTLGGVSRAMDVNDNGQIVGISTNAEGQIQPFHFDGAAIQAIRTPNDQPGHAYALNNDGTIVGFALLSETEGYAVQGNASGFDALGGLGDGTFSTALDINNDGTVVGTAQADEQYRAVVWGSPDLKGPDTPGSEGFGVNDEGLVVGTASLGDGQTQAFAGNALLPGDGQSRAYAVNNAGTVVGSIARDGAFAAVAWLSGEPIEVAPGGEAYGINDAGWIVGSHTPNAQASKMTPALPFALHTITERRTALASKSGYLIGSSGFVSIDGVLRDLTESIDPASGWQITEARSINANGEIAAVGVREGAVEALLLKPTSNLAPSARHDAATLAAGDVLLLDVLANDADPDGDALTLLAVNAAAHGQVEQVGDVQIRYTPPSGFHGLDTFTYVVSDGRGGSAVAEVAITVEPPLDFAGAVDLAPAYPNPFNPVTTLTLRAKTDAEVHLAVYDALGRHVRTVFAGAVARGQHTFTFEASGLASGLYLVRLTTTDGAHTQRLMLLK